jgi:hypothetical protein
VSEVLFSGLETQSEINRLLDQLYNSLDDAPQMRELANYTSYEWEKSEYEEAETGYFMLEPELV